MRPGKITKRESLDRKRKKQMHDGSRDKTLGK